MEKVVLVFQKDGNLVLYSGSSAIWSSGTFGRDGKYARLDDDGYLRIYNSKNTVLATF